METGYSRVLHATSQCRNVLRVVKEAPRSAGGVGKNFKNRPDLSSIQRERWTREGRMGRDHSARECVLMGQSREDSQPALKLIVWDREGLW